MAKRASAIVDNAIVEETTRLWTVREPMCPTRRELCQLADKVEGANFIPRRSSTTSSWPRSDIDAARGICHLWCETCAVCDTFGQL
jgi:hypothetical protein